MDKWYKLGGKASVLWDPTQPDPEKQTIALNEVKQLKLTDRVLNWKRSGALVELSESEAQAEMKAIDEMLVAQSKAASKAEKVLDKAGKKEAEASQTLREAEVKLKAAQKIISENEQLLENEKALKSRIAELEEQLKNGNTPPPQA